MTSRRPNNAPSVLSLSRSSLRASSNQESHPNRQLRPISIAREDTPIRSNDPTPRSYQSTEVPDTSTTATQERDSSTCSSSGHRQSQACAQSQAALQQNGQNGTVANEAYNMDTRRAPWYKKAAEKYGSLELENKGSVARDHLALERTFLAWLRTSLAFASIGIAITQLFRLNTSLSPDSANSSRDTDSSHPIAPILSPDKSVTLAPATDYERIRSLGKPLGATFIGIAIVVLFIGFHRYFESQFWVVRGKFPASRGSVAIVAFFTGALMIGSLVVILTMGPTALET